MPPNHTICNMPHIFHLPSVLIIVPFCSLHFHHYSLQQLNIVGIFFASFLRKPRYGAVVSRIPELRTCRTRAWAQIILTAEPVPYSLSCAVCPAQHSGVQRAFNLMHGSVFPAVPHSVSGSLTELPAFSALFISPMPVKRKRKKKEKKDKQTDKTWNSSTLKLFHNGRLQGAPFLYLLHNSELLVCAPSLWSLLCFQMCPPAGLRTEPSGLHFFTT